MDVVVFGSRSRKSDEDKQDVEHLLDLLLDKYSSSLVLLSMATDVGIGAFVKQICIERKKDFRFVEIVASIYASLPAPKMLKIYEARFLPLLALGDEFFIFPDDRKGGGMVSKFIRQIEDSGRPHKIFLPGDPVMLDAHD